MQDDLFARIEAANDMAGNLPDGAWWQRLEDAVTEYNTVHGTAHDPTEAVHQWVNIRGEAQ